MIAAYIHKKSEREVYVQNFTAVVIGKGFRKKKQGVVVFSEKGNSTTFVCNKEDFENEFILFHEHKKLK